MAQRSLANSGRHGATASDPGNHAAPARPPSMETFKLRLTRPHPLIQNTRRPPGALDPYGRPSRNDRQRLDVQASKAMFKPALVVMDRFLKALEAQDLKVEITEDQQGRGTYVCDGRDRVKLRIREITRKVEHVPSDKELREKERCSWTRIPKWDDLPTGELELTPGGRVDLTSDEAINLLIRKAVADVIENLADVRKKREAEEAARHQEWERRREIEEERSRVEAMHKAAAALRQYRLLTDYIEEVRRFGRVPDNQLRDGQTLEEWLAWAEWQAQQVHPLGE